MPRAWIPCADSYNAIFPGRAKAYTKQLRNGIQLLCVVTPDGPCGWHLGLSTGRIVGGNRAPAERYPSWDEVVEARYRFIPNDVTMAMLIPPREQYVNEFETCFQLNEIPTAEGEAGGLPNALGTCPRCGLIIFEQDFIQPDSGEVVAE